MPGDGGLVGWLLLSDQLSTDRFLDKLERTRNNNEIAVDNALLRHESEQIAASYNQLVAEFNELLRRASEVSKEADRKVSIIAELQHQAEELRSAKAALEVECDRLRQESKESRIEIAFLRETLRQEHPDRYLPE